METGGMNAIDRKKIADDMTRNGCMSVIWAAAVLALAIGMCSLLGSCSRRTTTEIVERVKTDTLYVSKVLVDTVRTRDSVLIEKAGDTVKIIERHWQDRVSVKMDTVYRAKTDSVPVPYPVEKKVAYTPVYMKILSGTGIVLLMLLMLWLYMKIPKLK